MICGGNRPERNDPHLWTRIATRKEVKKRELHIMIRSLLAIALAAKSYFIGRQMVFRVELVFFGGPDLKTLNGRRLWIET